MIHGVDTSPFMWSQREGLPKLKDKEKKKKTEKKGIRKEVYYLRHGVQTQELC